jgi:hypothetical protein
VHHRGWASILLLVEHRGTTGILGTMHELTWFDDTAPLPATRRALRHGSDAAGLLCAGGRLSPPLLDEA